MALLGTLNFVKPIIDIVIFALWNQLEVSLILETKVLTLSDINNWTSLGLNKPVRQVWNMEECVFLL